MNPGRQVVRTPGKDLWERRGWAWEQYLVAGQQVLLRKGVSDSSQQ